MNTEVFSDFIDELLKWNKSINLVQESTTPSIHDRHILNSLLIKPHLDYDKDVIVDIGSGAGFPGLVLAIDGAKNVHLVEPTGKKVVFLNHIKNIYKLPLQIHECRWQDLKLSNATVVTSRAFASLTNLLGAMSFVSREIKEARGIFLKGAKVKEEIVEAKENWNFDMEIFENPNHERGCVLKVSKVSRK